jgi:hypothetical protein
VAKLCPAHNSLDAQPLLPLWWSHEYR